MKKLYSITLLIIAVIISPAPAPAGQNKAQEKTPGKNLQYNVSVQAHLVPIFAVDKKGDPVYDLKQEEIQLYLNGKPIEIISFSRFQLEGREANKEKKAKEKPGTSSPLPVEVPLKAPERLNFLILDTAIGNLNTMGLARGIAMGIIRNAAPGDAYIILQTDPKLGFRYIAGPEKDKKKLARVLNAMKNRYNVNRRHSPSRVGSSHGEVSALLMGARFEAMKGVRQLYQRDIWFVTRALKQLKYALKSIKLPKTVYLIANSPKRYVSIDDMPIDYLRYLEDSAKAINYGGSMLYVIDSLPRLSKQNQTGLKFMADQVGGKFIGGASIREIVGKVKSSTSAYYELAYYPSKESGLKGKVRVECKREDVELTTIGYTEKDKPYRRLNKIEKELFALNVVNGGAWSRMIAEIARIKYKKQSSQTVEVPIPPVMRNRKLDMFLVYMNPLTQEATFVFEKKVLEAKADIRFTPMKNRVSYFVIIDPRTHACIYNKVI